MFLLRAAFLCTFVQELALIAGDIHDLEARVREVPVVLENRSTDGRTRFLEGLEQRRAARIEARDADGHHTYEFLVCEAKRTADDFFD